MAKELSDEGRIKKLLAEGCSQGRVDIVNKAIRDNSKNVVDVNCFLEINYFGLLKKKLKEKTLGLKNDSPELTAESPSQCTPLHIACAFGQVDCVRTLLIQGAKADAIDSSGNLPLHLCALAEAEKSMNVRTAFQQELLQRVASGQIEGVRELIRGGVSANARDGTDVNSTALHWAAAFGQPREMINTLVDSGAQVDLKNSKGQTPLHEACEQNHVNSAVSLIELGANPIAIDNEGFTPTDLAGENELVTNIYDAVMAKLKGSRAKTLDARGKHILNFKNAKVRDQDPDEVSELRRMKEETDLTVVSLRETIELLLEKHGTRKYIVKLKREYDDLLNKFEILDDEYESCKVILTRTVADNEILRKGLEKRLSQVSIDGGAHRPHQIPMNSLNDTEEKDSSNSRQLKDYETVEFKLSNTKGYNAAVELLVLERNRLAKELESERRLRFSEARLHLLYTARLREQLKEAQGKSINQIGEADSALAADKSSTTENKDSSESPKEDLGNIRLVPSFFRTFFEGKSEE